MLRSAKDLHGYRILATDGKIGGVRDLYFDDSTWVVRYVVVDTGKWLPGRRVLISPVEFGEPNWKDLTVPVSLTKERVKNSPSAESDKPVSRQHEMELHRYYGWPLYWMGPPPGETPMGLSAEGIAAQKAEADRAENEPGEREPEGDANLRSVREVTGYGIHATDGDIGHVEDFIIDTPEWIIRYMVVDTRNWLPGRKVLVAPAWIESVDWADRAVKVAMTREEIKSSPEFDASAPVNREYETRLYDYYGRPAYWRES